MARSIKLSEVNEAAEGCITQLVREEMHVCALTVIDLHECDGMNMEFLFNQPSHGEWLEAMTKEA